MNVNRAVILSFWVVMVLAGLPLLANADNSVPPLINYQGQLTDANGNPQTGTKKLEFNIYDASSGGNKVWGPQTFNAVPLIGGRFNVILGSTDAGGNAITVAFAANSRFLGIKVDNGAEIAPRQQILSTPFAFSAQNATNAVNAQNASNAQNAQNANHAVLAENSNQAALAANANLLGGKTIDQLKIDFRQINTDACTDVNIATGAWSLCPANTVMVGIAEGGLATGSKHWFGGIRCCGFR
jgi:hypothetical protein